MSMPLEDLCRPSKKSKRELARLFEAILTMAAADRAIEEEMFHTMSDSLRSHVRLTAMLLDSKGIEPPNLPKRLQGPKGESRGRKMRAPRARRPNGDKNDAWLRQQLEGLGS